MAGSWFNWGGSSTVSTGVNTGVVPKPNQGPSPIIPPVPGPNTQPIPAFSINDTPMQKLVVRLAKLEDEMEALSDILSKALHDVKVKEPVSPRRSHSVTLFTPSTDTQKTDASKSKDAVKAAPEKPKDDKQTASKGIPFTEAALENMRKDMLEQTSKIADRIRKIDNGDDEKKPVSRTVTKLQKDDLIELCQLNRTLAREYRGLLNDVQTVFTFWRTVEAVGEMVMNDFMLRSIAKVTEELVDRWLYRKVQDNMNEMIDDINKVRLDIDRALKCVEVYQKPAEPTALLDKSMDAPSPGLKPSHLSL